MEKPGVYLMNMNSEQMWALVTEGNNILGREATASSDNHIILAHPTVSRQHARIWLDPESQRWHVQNLSKNGSGLNQQPLYDRNSIKHGDRLTIGSFQLMFNEKFHSNADTMEIPAQFAPPPPPPLLPPISPIQLGTARPLPAALIILAIAATLCILWLCEII